MDIRNEKLRAIAFEGNFGLEREALRIVGNGRFASTSHPFPGYSQIVRDFCENQTEINTQVHASPESALCELMEIDAEVRGTLAALPEREWLWPFSNPPPIADDSEIKPAMFEGVLVGKSAYRAYLATKYGKRKMALCGIHLNFSFGEDLVATAAEVGGTTDITAFRNCMYLNVSERLLEWGWVVVPMTAASPILDASFLVSGNSGDVEVGMASFRCSELGYWNHFTPVLDFSGVHAYADSIMKYINDGLIASPGELYYPIRLKPLGPNRLGSLVAGGIDHLELRCIDLNPFEGGLVDLRDIRFVQLLVLWCAAQPSSTLSPRDQVQSVMNYKNAARYDLESAEIVLRDGRHGSVRRASLLVLDMLSEFYSGFPKWVDDVLSFERGKLEDVENRPASKVKKTFADTFAEKGLAWAKDGRRWNDV